MTDADVLDVTVDMIWCIIKCSAPLLLVSLIVGLVISIFQTVTSIQEQTLTFVPKLLAIFITMLICGGNGLRIESYMWWMDYEQLRGTFYKTV